VTSRSQRSFKTDFNFYASSRIALVAADYGIGDCLPHRKIDAVGCAPITDALNSLYDFRNNFIQNVRVRRHSITKDHHRPLDAMVHEAFRFIRVR
jgi:hypothetical protein